MKIHLHVVPHHLGKDVEASQTGPAVLADAAVSALERDGHTVRTHRVPVRSRYDTEHDAVASIAGALAASVNAAADRDALVVVATGNCATSLGALAGCDPARTALLWFDAHGDFNTPETSPSGMLDGMPVAIATGRCYSDVWGAVAGAPIRDENVVIAGLRAADPGERAAIDESAATALAAGVLRAPGAAERIDEAAKRLARSAEALHIHLDLDALDPGVSPGVAYREPDGLREDEMGRVIDGFARRVGIRSVSVAAFDPSFDEDDATRRLAVRLLARTASAARRA